MAEFTTRLPGTPGAWPDSLRARLFDQRIVLLSGSMDEQVANQAAVELMTLDASGDEAVELRLDSGGGSLGAAMTLMDVIELLGVPVHVTGLGQVAGPAIGILAVADRRQATPSTRFRLSEPHDSTTGVAGQLQRWAAQRQEQWVSYCTRVAAAVGKPVDRVVDDMATGVCLSADEALAYGLLDEVRRPMAGVRRLPGSGRVGFAPPG